MSSEADDLRYVYDWIVVDPDEVKHTFTDMTFDDIIREVKQRYIKTNHDTRVVKRMKDGTFLFQEKLPVKGHAWETIARFSIDMPLRSLGGGWSARLLNAEDLEDEDSSYGDINWKVDSDWEGDDDDDDWDSLLT